MNWKKIIRKSIIISGVIILITAFSAKETDRFEIVKSLDVFTALFQQVNSLYVEEVQPGSLMQEGIDGMLKSLDPYTVYYPESEIEDYKMLTTGQYGGIGARIRRIDSALVLYEVFEASPAMKAGLKIGDEIIAVDQHQLKGESSHELSKILKGVAGTTVEIEVLRNKKNITVTLKREEITISSIPYQGLVANEVGYIKVHSFTRAVSSDFRKALESLKYKQNCKSLIVDLRGNPGGLLLESIDMVNLFTKKGEKVVETKGKIEEWNKVYRNMNKPLDLDLPVIVLVDRKSASASEIVSGSLQDMDRAVIVGESTFGKGLVQTTVNLPFNSSMKVTTAKYYIPSGRCIQEIDYGKRDEEGKAIALNDSVFKTFKTRIGRTVNDGHGIMPDIVVKEDELREEIFGLREQEHFFHYCNRFMERYEGKLDSTKIQVEEEDLQHFITYLKEQKELYVADYEHILKSFNEKTKEDTLLHKMVGEMEEYIQKMKQDQLYSIKEDLRYELEKELARRLYFEKGLIRKNLERDKVLKEAVRIAQDPNIYASYLANNP